MARPKKGTAPGRSSDFSGEKEAWLATYREQVIDADDIGAVYTDATNAFLLRYGYDLPFGDNVDGDPDDNPPPTGPVSDAEQDRRDAIRGELRLKLGNYFRNKFKGKKVHLSSIKKILGAMQSMSGPAKKPRRLPDFAVYSKLYYATRVKPGFEKKWNEAKKTMPKTERAAMSQDFVMDYYDKESAEVKAEVEEAGKEMHRVALEAWKAKRKIPEHSAEEYNRALETLPDVAIPLADALSEHLGAHVAILVVGPVGTEGGEVLLRSVFSDTSAGAITRTWPQYDRRGFTAMEESITRFGRAFFTTADCRERAWPPIEVEDAPGAAGTSGTSAPVHTAGPGPTTPAPGPAGPVLAPGPPVGPSAAARAPAPARAKRAKAIAGAAVPDPSSLENLLSFDDEGSERSVVEPPVVESVVDEPSTLTDGMDTSEWSPHLIGAYAYLSEKKFGPRWQELVKAMFRFEWAHFYEENSFGMTARGRPAEIAQWMKEHRRWVDQPLMEEEHGAIGPRFLAYYKAVGPRGRWEDVEEGTAATREIAAGDHIHWSLLDVTGRNGQSLLVLTLAWWGQAIWNAGVGNGIGGGEAALESAADWKLLVEDMMWALNMLATIADRPDREAQIAAAEAVLGEEPGAKKKKKAAKAGAAKAGGGEGGREGEEKIDDSGAGTDAPAAKARRTTRGRVAEDEEAGVPALPAPPAATTRPKPRALVKRKAASEQPGTPGEMDSHASGGRESTPLNASVHTEPVNTLQPQPTPLNSEDAVHLSSSSSTTPTTADAGGEMQADEDPFAGFSPEELEEMMADKDANVPEDEEEEDKGMSED
ncbi:hypothetical protein C8R47DRAFT_1216263 [Mycena vitilis]|nr:hypothetical protein C8R47DRAFT_1216263 [Mycena vitilis]